MRASKKQLKHNLALLLVSGLLSAVPAMAATDQSEHANHVDKSVQFHGIFYGFLPCKDCTGIKATLSLKQNNNYLLVTQHAKESSRELYEKGKYSWNDEDKTVVLTPSKGGTITRQYHIESEGTLIQLNDDGTKMPGEADKYVLRSSDTVKSREVHIH